MQQKSNQKVSVVFLRTVSEAGALTCVVKRSQDPQLVHGVQHVVFRRRVHEVEEQELLNSQWLEQQHNIGQVSALDLWDSGGEHLILVGTLSV